MASFTDFDKYFLNLPPLTREKNFNLFWQKAIQDIKKVPLEPELVLDKDKTSARFEVSNLVFKSFLKTPVYATLYNPKVIDNPKVIIIIHDYNDVNSYKNFELDENLAYLFLQLRGHHILQETPVVDPKNKNAKQIVNTPGFITENILDANSYYLKGIYLDTISAIKSLRLNKNLDCSSIGIIGKGLGAAAALFAAAHSKRISALAIDAPAFSNLQISQNISSSVLTKEINNFINHSKLNKNKIKKNLTYFDTINFADKIKCPVLMSIGLKNSFNPAECAFSLFNHLICDKTVEVFPNDGYDAGGEELFKKSIKWIKTIISN